MQDVTPPVDAEGYATIMRAAATEGDVIRCRCGMQVEDGGMVQCDACGAWQHTVCMDTATHRWGAADARGDGSQRHRAASPRAAKGQVAKAHASAGDSGGGASNNNAVAISIELKAVPSEGASISFS